MVTDLTNSAVAIAVQTLARDKHRVDLVTSTATTALTNKECSPYDAHWTFDAYELSAGTARAVVAEGGRTWFFVTADYTFGANLEGTAKREIERSGGKCSAMRGRRSIPAISPPSCCGLRRPAHR